MNDEAQEQAMPPQAEKPAKKAGAQARSRTKAMAAHTSESIASPRTHGSVVPEISAPSKRASPWRLGFLTATLALLVGGLAWFSEVPDLQRPDFAGANLGFPLDLAAAPIPEPAQEFAKSSQSVEQELRLATMALDIRESQESLVQLWEDTRALATSLGILTTGIQRLNSEVSSVRADATTALARVEKRADTEVAAAEPILLGDPALRNANQPVTTGALADRNASPQANVQVSLAKAKPAKSPKPISGWVVHGVRDNLAHVESKGTHYEVKEGETLPEAGRVKSIKKRGEKWVVLTSKGIISQAN